MGAKWEVCAWTEGEIGYAYRTVYYGESFWKAAWAAQSAKRAGAGCVKVKWR